MIMTAEEALNCLEAAAIHGSVYAAVTSARALIEEQGDREVPEQIRHSERQAVFALSRDRSLAR